MRRRWQELLIIGGIAAVLGHFIGHWLGLWGAPLGAAVGIAIGFYGARYFAWRRTQAAARAALTRDNHETLR